MPSGLCIRGEDRSSIKLFRRRVYLNIPLVDVVRLFQSHVATVESNVNVRKLHKIILPKVGEKVSHLLDIPLVTTAFPVCVGVVFHGRIHKMTTLDGLKLARVLKHG